VIFLSGWWIGQSEEDENLKDGVRGSCHNGEEEGMELGGKECVIRTRGLQYSSELGLGWSIKSYVSVSCKK